MKTHLTYDEGYKAGQQGKTPPDNPYPKDTPAYKDWLDGLMDASL